ncbi:hypothetical protein [Ornithinibacillus xuwenensis]|uniref:Stage III sporulation protein AH n=1 Tax=Ornithinibacillus xuwenensis TaxID=3144668 RepID=A0ABU9XJF0_9BACI
MKKLMFTFIIMAILAIGFFQLAPVLANENHEQRTQKQQTPTVSEEESKDNQQTASMAIRETESKDNEDNVVKRSEVRKNKISEEEFMQYLADEIGVEADGKNVEKLKSDIREEMILAKAKEAGISTDGKSIETIIEEMKSTTFDKKKEETNIEDYRVSPSLKLEQGEENK